MSGEISANTLTAVDNTRPLFNSSSFSSYPVVLPQGVSRNQVEIPEPYLTYLNQAIERWSRFIKFNPAVYDSIKTTNANFNGISLDQTCEGVGNPQNGFYLYNDPSSNGIASCGVYSAYNLGSLSDIQYNTETIYFDINDAFRNVFTDEEWVDVLTHEMGHGLGIGQLWTSYINNVDWDGDNVADPGAVPPTNSFLNGTYYTNCRNGYRKLINNGTSYNQIPLEDTGGPGTKDAHFENNYRSSSYSGGAGLTYPGLENELMLGVIVPGGTMRISSVTIGALLDFGYQEVNPGNNEGHVHLNNGTSALSIKASERILPKARFYNCCDTSQKPIIRGTINI
jgi:hypothetical protein